MKYIKQSQANNLLFYHDQFSTAQPVTIFKIKCNSADITKYVGVTKVSGASFDRYTLTLVASEGSQDLENGIAYMPQGGFWTLEVYESPNYTTDVTNLTKLWEEQLSVAQLNDTPLGLVPKSIFLFGPDYQTGVKLYNNSVYLYNDELFRFVGDDGYVSSSFIDDYNNNLFERLSQIQDWTIATLYFEGRYVLQGGTLYRCITTHTSSGNFASDSANWLAISGSGGGGIDPTGLYLPLSGGTMTGDILMSADPNYIAWNNYEQGILVNDAGENFDFYNKSTNIGLYDNGTERYVRIYETGTPRIFRGAVYADDYSANYNDRSLVDKGYVTNAIANAGGVTRQTFVLTNLTDITGSTTSAATVGDIAIISNDNTSYILQNTPYSNINNWIEILSPDSVISVNGQTGVVNVNYTNLSGMTGINNGVVVKSGNTIVNSGINLDNFVTSGDLSQYLPLAGGTMNGTIYSNPIGMASLNIGTGNWIELDTDGFNGLYYEAGTGAGVLLYNNNGLNELRLRDSGKLTAGGISNFSIDYDSDYTANFSSLSLVHKGYVDTAISNVDISTKLDKSGDTATGLLNYSSNLTGQTNNTLIHRQYADGRYAPLSHTHQLTDLLNTNTNKIIISNGTHLTASTVTLSDVLTSSSSIAISAVTGLQTSLDSINSNISANTASISANTASINSINALLTGYSYSQYVAHGSTNPVDNESRIFSVWAAVLPSLFNATNYDQLSVRVNQRCILNGAELIMRGGSSSGEDWSMYITVNQTTDYLIQTIATASGFKKYQNFAMDIQLEVGDTWCVKSVQPAFATNPTAVVTGGYVYFTNN